MTLRALIVGALLCCLPPLAAGATPPAAADPVRVDAAAVDLMPAARIVADAEGKLSADALLAAPDPGAPPARGPMASLGFSNSTYWFEVPLLNPDAAPLHRLLVFEPTWLDDVRVTLAAADGTRQSFEGGDLLPFAQRALPHRKINFAFDVPPGPSRLLVRVHTRDPFVVGMTLWQRGDFFAAESGTAGYFGFVYGAMAALLLYNLVLFFSVRERVYAAYVGYLLSFLAMHATYNGHLYPLLWPDSPAWGNWAHSVFIYLFQAAGLSFAISFLELRARMPDVYRWAKRFLAVLAASFCLTALAGYHVHVASSILWVVVYSPFVLTLGIRSMLAGNRAARYFLVATAAGFVGSFVTAMTVSGLIPFSAAGYRAVDVGMLIDAVLLSLALADRLRLSRAEADRAKADLIDAGRMHARRLEETVAQRTVELSRANEIKDKFFAIVAHDLRGPVGGLAALFNEVIRSPADISDEILAITRTTTQSTKLFLEELLIWARSQRGEIDFRPAAFDMAWILKETQELFAIEARTKGIELDLIGAGSCWVHADMAMVHTILRNLAHNALKFTDSGGSVRALLRRDGDRCIVTIADTGIGMSEAQRRDLFRLDIKAPSSPGTRNESGTGLGLVLCKEFAERNGGAIGVDSERGQGSSFWFSLPAASEADVVDPQLLFAQVPELRILVAEDDKLHRDAAARILRELGCSPAFAGSGEEAVRLAQAEAFDLILMDIDMPQIDGIEAARRIRAGGGRSRIVSLSSYSRQEIVRRAPDVTFDEYLYKPLTRDDALLLASGCLAREPR
ncbi:MAG TPA: 7TM diverse intracellular signaling domain-containing protein [Rhodocyclaceae bacterium]